MAEAYVSNAQSVLSETFDDDTVLVNFVTGNYFSLRGAAPVIWSLLQSPTTAERIAAAIADDPSIALGDVRTMIETLVAEDCVLTVNIDESKLTDLPKQSLNGSYSPPVLETFRDLQELITIDPVHEVDDDGGWPHRPARLGL